MDPLERYPYRHADPSREKRLFQIRCRIEEQRFPELRGVYGRERIYKKYALEMQVILNRPSLWRAFLRRR